MAQTATEAQQAPFTITGEYRLHDSLAARAECEYTQAGYSDVHASAPVVIRDDAGRVIAQGSLWYGVPDGKLETCAFPFIVPVVPPSLSYTIEVGSRGEVPLTQPAAREPIVLENG